MNIIGHQEYTLIMGELGLPSGELVSDKLFRLLNGCPRTLTITLCSLGLHRHYYGGDSCLATRSTVSSYLNSWPKNCVCVSLIRGPPTTHPPQMVVCLLVLFKTTNKGYFTEKKQRHPTGTYHVLSSSMLRQVHSQESLQLFSKLASPEDVPLASDSIFTSGRQCP